MELGAQKVKDAQDRINNPKDLPNSMFSDDELFDHYEDDYIPINMDNYLPKGFGSGTLPKGFYPPYPKRLVVPPKPKIKPKKFKMRDLGICGDPKCKHRKKEHKAGFLQDGHCSVCLCPKYRKTLVQEHE